NSELFVPEHLFALIVGKRLLEFDRYGSERSCI
ncbi:MAG: hypothetical protein G01um101429_1151, partial [Parcubacteria group bacterium Gr01-1014_29]